MSKIIFFLSIPLINYKLRETINKGLIDRLEED